MRPGPPHDSLPKVVSSTSDQDQFVHIAMVYLAGSAAVQLLDPRPHEWPHGELEEYPGEIGGDGDECFAHEVCWEGAGGEQPLEGLKGQPELYERASEETSKLLEQHETVLRRLALALHHRGSLSADVISEILLSEAVAPKDPPSMQKDLPVAEPNSGDHLALCLALAALRRARAEIDSALDLANETGIRQRHTLRHPDDGQSLSDCGRDSLRCLERLEEIVDGARFTLNDLGCLNREHAGPA